METIGTLSVLGKIPQETILTRKNLADIIDCHARTIKRMEQRGELPAAIKFHGKFCYTVAAIIEHIQHLAEKARESSNCDRRRLGLEVL